MKIPDAHETTHLVYNNAHINKIKSFHENEKMEKSEMTERLKAATLLLAESEKENERLNEQVEQLKSRIEYLEEQLNGSIENNLVNEFMETNFF